MEDKHEYLNTEQICELYPFTKGQLFYFLNLRHKNGLANAVRKIGKRIYFRRDLFNQWIESHKRST